MFARVAFRAWSMPIKIAHSSPQIPREIAYCQRVAARARSGFGCPESAASHRRRLAVVLGSWPILEVYAAMIETTPQLAGPTPRAFMFVNAAVSAALVVFL